MQAIAEHWLTREIGLRAYKAAERALTAANCTSNVELITRALFEYARSGCEVGDEERVKDAEKRVRELLVLQKAQELPSVHYVLAYCHYFSCDVLQAAKCLERTISLLSGQQGAIDLFQAYLAYGACLRSEEHTSELQSPCNLVCRLLLEKKKNGFTPAPIGKKHPPQNHKSAPSSYRPVSLPSTHDEQTPLLQAPSRSTDADPNPTCEIA